MEEKIEYMPVQTSAGVANLCVHIWPAPAPRGKVICFHEMACTAVEFAFLAEVLNSAGFDVICPDWIGHGQSTYFSGKNAYRWYDFVACAMQTIRRYGVKDSHVLGASLGGMILFVLLVASRLKPKTATFVDIPLHKGVG